MIEFAMRQILSGTATFPASRAAAVADALATLRKVGDRFRPNQAALDDCLPLIVYENSGSEDCSPPLDGRPSGWWLTTMTVTAVSTSYEEAQALGAAVGTVLSNFVGTAPNGVQVSYFAVTGQSDDEQDREGADPLHLRSVTLVALST